MTSVSATVESTPGRLQQLSTRIIFLISGIGLAIWAPLVPFAKDRLAVGDGVLGLLLLCLGAGSILAMPLAGPFVARFGCRRVILVSGVLMCAILPSLAVVSTVPGLAVALFLFGAGVGSLDVSMNMQAIIVERASGRSMMSGFHGLFSLGAIAGAGGMALMLSLGLTPLEAALSIVSLLLLGLVAMAPYLLTYGGDSEGPPFAIPRGIVLLIGAVCFVSFLTEGAMLDWTALFFISKLDVNVASAGLGYAAFSVTMTLGRLTGDRFVQRFGGTRIVVLGGVLGAVGILLLTWSPSWSVGLVGCALVGAGCSNIVPVMFTSAGRQTEMPEQVAVPAVATLGYMGVLMGPAAIGFVSHLLSLSTAFLLLAFLLIGVAVSGRLLKV